MAEDNIPVGGVREEPFFNFGDNIDIPLQINEQGNVILYRTTDSPDYLQVSDFTQKNTRDIGTLGFGQHTYFGPNIETPQAFWVASTNRGLYKYDTNIKPNQIFIGNIGDKPELAKALGIPEQYWNMNYHRFLIETKDTYRKILTDNIETFKEYGIKALGRFGGTSGEKSFEIIPLITNEDNLGVKAVAELEPIKGIGKGGAANWKVKEVITDTPTNVVDERKFYDPSDDVDEFGLPLTDEAKEEIRSLDNQLIDDDGLNGLTMPESPQELLETGKPGNIVLTEDGYKFLILPDGQLTDGDMIYGSLRELRDEVSADIIDTLNSEEYKNKLKEFKDMGVEFDDTPTNVAGAEVIDEIEGIQRETIEKLRNANDAFVAEQVDDIMARKINEVLPFVDTSLSRAEAIGISTTGPQITRSADSTLNTFIDDIEKITGQTLDITEKRKLRQFLYDVATDNEYGLLNDAKSFKEGITVNASKLNDPGYKVWKNWQNSGAFIEKNITGMTPNEFTSFGPPDYVYLVEGLEKSGESINFTAISDADVNIPNELADNWVDNYAKTTTSFIDNLPLSTTVKNQFNNLVQGRAKNLATPGGVADAVDVWELGVLGLMIAAVAYKEYDEIPTILTNKAVDMFNNMTSFYGIPPVPKEQYDLDYEFINKVVETGEKFMPTDIVLKKVAKEAKKTYIPYGDFETKKENIDPQETKRIIKDVATSPASYYRPTSNREAIESMNNQQTTDTMETTQKIQPGVQEEKMFKKAKPQKGSGAGSGVKIL